MSVTASFPQFRAVSRRKVLRWSLPVVVTAILGAILGSSVAAVIDIPEVETMGELSPSQVTNLLDREGTVFKQYSLEKRYILEEGQVPKLIEQALIASEDAHFYSHGGIDAVGIARSAVHNALHHDDNPQGASTLTMQLAGNLYLDRSQRTWRRKIPEAFYAVALEKVYSKEQILTRYANEMNLGHGNYGFEAASRFYFDKPAAEDTLPEAALLVSILPKPSDWSPIRRPDFMRQRRNLVLGRMLHEDFITKQEYEEAVAQPLGVVPVRQKHQEAAYFAEEIRKNLLDHYDKQGLYERGLRVRTTLDPRTQEAAEAALRFGLVRIDRIRGWRGAQAKVDPTEATTVERNSWRNLHLEPGLWVEGVVLESNARQAVVRVAKDTFVIGKEAVAWTSPRGNATPRRVLKPGDIAWFEVHAREENEDGTPAKPIESARDLTLELTQEPEVEGAVVVLDIATGAIRALVGGWDFQRSEFDRAVQARRQVGSAFKPFVYGTAFESRYSPADTLFDAPVAFVGADNLPSYSPRNYYKKYEGIITLRQALEKSINVTAVKLQDLVGVDRVIEFARRCGISSPLRPFPSLALGSAELTPLELTAAYASFANQGLWIEPYMIETVESSSGRVLERHQATASQAMDADVAYLLTNVLRGVASPRGTAPSLAQVGVPIAGKTGTTNDYSDAWFVGMTPRLAIGVWVGFDQKKTIGPPHGPRMTGYLAAVPIWKHLADQGVAEGWIPTGEDFVPPSGVIFRPVDLASGLAATPSSPHVINEAFIPGTEPVQEYSPRWQQILALPWYQQRAFYGKPKEGENMPEDVEDWSLIQNFDTSNEEEFTSERGE